MTDTSPRKRAAKSSSAFRTISEVSDSLDVPQHVLRFWESKFSQLRPMKRGGGRRYYRPEDIALLSRIRELLYDDGYTIKGVQKLLKERGVAATLEGGAAAPGLSETSAEPASVGSDSQGEGAGAPQLPLDMPTAGGLSRKDRLALASVLEELGEMQGILAAALGDGKETEHLSR